MIPTTSKQTRKPPAVPDGLALTDRLLLLALRDGDGHHLADILSCLWPPPGARPRRWPADAARPSRSRAARPAAGRRRERLSDTLAPLGLATAARAAAPPACRWSPPATATPRPT